MRRKIHENNEPIRNNENEAQDETLDLRTAQLQEQLEASKNELAEVKDARLRLQADFDNFRRRVRQEQMLDRQKGVEDFVTTLLPVLDNFERALDAAKRTQNFDAMMDGVNGIVRQLGDLLKRYEIEPISAAGQPFDPTYHDAIQSVTSAEVPDHVVIAEVEKGYTMSGRVIRPSKVIVSTGSGDGE